MKLRPRNRIDLFTSAEKAIFEAQQELEKESADVKLTEAGILLQKAIDLVADYVDDQQASLKVAAKQLPTNNVTEVVEKLEGMSYVENKRFEDDEDVLVIELGRAIKIVQSLSSPKKQEAKQLPTNNVTEEMIESMAVAYIEKKRKQYNNQLDAVLPRLDAYQNGAKDIRKLLSAFASRPEIASIVSSVFREARELKELNKMGEIIEKYTDVLLSLSSPKKQEAKQLHEVKDWDSVFDEWMQTPKRSGNIIDFVKFLKQHYLLPSEQTPLKELSEISDEDEMELCNILNTNTAEHFINHLIGKHILYTLNVRKTIEAYQYLQSKNYSLPKYY